MDIKSILETWGLSQYYEIFEANKITVTSLGLINDTLAKELIAPVGDRAIFIKNIENWKKIVEDHDLDESMVLNLAENFDDVENSNRVPLQDVSNITALELNDNIEISFAHTSTSSITPPTNTEILEPLPGTSTQIEETLIVSGDSELENLLSCTSEGKAILNLHKESGLLSSSSRRKICNIIIRHLLGDDLEKRVSSTQLMQYAQKITLLFAKENISTYFIPYVNNHSLKIKRCAKGKLYDCLQNRRREFREAKLIPTKKLTSEEPRTTSSPCNGNEVSGNVENDINWLKVSCEPWRLVEEKWRNTATYRLKEIDEKKLSVAEYMDLYPVLKKPIGYHLFISDFKHLYPEHENNFIENFPLLKEKLFKVLFNKHTRNSDPAIQEVVRKSKEYIDKTNDVRSKEITSIQVLILLALTLAQPQSKTKKNIWRPSKIESKDGFITHIARPMDLQETINNKREKFAALGVTLQPFIIIVGPTIAEIHAYYVIVNNTFYVVNTIQEAVDACFKIFHSLNCNYPQECVALWTFIQKALYKFKTPWDKEFVSVNTLLSDLI